MDDTFDPAISQKADDAPRGALSGTLLAALGAVIPPGAEVRWSGPAQLQVKPKGKTALAVTTAGIAIAIARGDEVESRFVAGSEIRWVSAGRVKARLSLADGERLDVKVRDASFFTALLGMSRRDVPPTPDAPGGHAG
jgi:hypothetical protein